MDVQLGRWHVVDAMAERYMHESPYAYVGNNAISRTDFMGLTYQYKDPDNNRLDNLLHGGGINNYLNGLNNHLNDNLHGIGGASYGSNGWTSSRASAGGHYVTNTTVVYEDVWEVDKNGKKINLLETNEISRTSETHWAWDSFSFTGKVARDYKRIVAKSKGKVSPTMIALAHFLRNSRFIPITIPPFFTKNPFYGAEAISGDLGVLGFAGEADRGLVLILAGDDIGKLLSYKELSDVSIAMEADGGIEIARLDFTGNYNDFKSEYIYGKRHKVWIGVGLSPESYGFGIGTSVSWGKARGTSHYIITTALSIGWGIAPLPIMPGYNHGTINP